MRTAALRILLVGLLCPFLAQAADSQTVLIERGRYLVQLSGCNDCHTPGYGMAHGAIPESDWLIGDPTGWTGPWGTTFAINIRAQVNSMSADQWMALVSSIEARPPMPWYVLHQMTNEDLLAVFTFIRSLGPSAHTVPDYLPPGKVPTAPYFELVLPKAK